MKRKLLIEVDCGDVVCGHCYWYDNKGGACTMFDVRLVDEMVRERDCLKAEEEARALQLNRRVD